MAAAALAILALSCTSETTLEQARPNLVMIVVDTLRADHLGCYGYGRNTSPAIDALAAESIRFERAYSTAPWTKPALASIVTGLYPSHHGVDRMLRVLPDSAKTLAEHLRESGYRSAGIVSHSLLGKKFGFDQGFDSYDESQAKGHDHISTPEVIRRAKARLSELVGAEHPFFLFVHLFDPHDTYRPHADIDFAAAAAGRIKAGQRSPRVRLLDPPPNDAEAQLLRDLYDEEIRFTDRGIGELIDALSQSGELDRTVVVLTADHGEEFFERGWLGHGSSMFDELLRVPLLLRLPGGKRAGTVDRQPISLVGLMPTLRDVLDVRDIDEVEARAPYAGTGSFLRPETRSAPIYAELNYVPRETGKTIPKQDDPWLRAVIDGNYKLVYDRVDDTAKLFDLSEDPREKKDLVAELPERTATMRALIGNAPNRKSNRRLERKKTTLTDAQKEMLRKLGYGE